MTSSDITRRAKSNLAYALKILPKDRRDHMIIFYAYCRVIDDIADDETKPVAERKKMLEHWKNGLLHGFSAPNDFQQEVTALIQKENLSLELMTAIIDGCTMDTEPQRFGTWEDLQKYTWKVACAVGLISLKLFGANHPQSETYAVHLGHALQLTNILRDVGEDLANGVRIYLPLADMARFQYSERDLIGRVYDGRFLAMMTYQAERANNLYLQAEKSLPKDDAKALIAAEVMREIYHKVLTKMQTDHFRVFEKRYALSKIAKLAILAKKMAKG